MIVQNTGISYLGYNYPIQRTNSLQMTVYAEFTLIQPFTNIVTVHIRWPNCNLRPNISVSGSLCYLFSSRATCTNGANIAAAVGSTGREHGATGRLWHGPKFCKPSVGRNERLSSKGTAAWEPITFLTFLSLAGRSISINSKVLIPACFITFWYNIGIFRHFQR